MYFPLLRGTSRFMHTESGGAAQCVVLLCAPGRIAAAQLTVAAALSSSVATDARRSSGRQLHASDST
jgi:hypothetical protein